MMMIPPDIPQAAQCCGRTQRKLQEEQQKAYLGEGACDFLIGQRPGTRGSGWSGATIDDTDMGAMDGFFF
jgi:hypothetical protein